MPDVDNLIGYTTARIIVRSAPDQLLELAKDRAFDAAVFDEHPPFIWANEISSNRLDAYYTIMDPLTTLPNFAADAAAGVAVLVGHDTRSLPVGYSLTGAIEHIGEVSRVLSDAYAIADEATTPLINKMRAGIIRDDSVGFPYRGAKCICSICGRDMWRDWDCWHIPGFEYEVSAKGSDGSEGAKIMTLATGLITGAHLSEYSLVFDGATPGAAILQAQKAAEAGRLSTNQARLIEQRYRVNLPGKRLITEGVTMPPEHSNGKTAPAETHDDRQLQIILEKAGVPTDLVGLARIEWLADELAILRPLAADGQTYRADLVEEGVGQAVRAFGAEAGEKKRAMLKKADLSDIKELTESWRAIGDSKLPGGRKTTDESDPDTSATWRKVNTSHLHG